MGRPAPRRRRSLLVVALGAAGVLLWGWLVAEVLAGDLRLVIDFEATSDPLARLWRLALPEMRSPTAGDWLRYAAWAVGPRRRRPRRLALRRPRIPRSPNPDPGDPCPCHCVGSSPPSPCSPSWAPASSPAATTTAAASATSARTVARPAARRAARRPGRRAASASGSASSASGTGETACSPVGEDLEADAAETVDITLSEYEFDPSEVTVAAGVVTFAATNDGTEDHELAFLPGGGEIPLTDDGAPDEDALAEAGAFELEAFGPGQSCNATYELEAGDLHCCSASSKPPTARPTPPRA